METIATELMKAWKDAATEHVRLRSMFETGYPYMTVYIDSPIQCSDHRILKDLYDGHGEPRTAQVFVCSLGVDKMDVINVHAPSGRYKLKDTERTTLMENLLQSNSHAMPGHTIGK